MSILEMRTLVLAELTENGDLRSTTFNALEAARQIGAPIDVLIATKGEAREEFDLALEGKAERYLLANHPTLAHGLPEPLATLLVSLAKEYTHIIAPATTFGKNVMPRVAALLDVMQISDMTRVISADTFERPIYAGNAILTIQSIDAIKIITARPTAFSVEPDSLAKWTEKALQKIEVYVPESPALSIWEKLDAPLSSRPDLSSAAVVVSGGRGLKSQENFQLIEKLADLLHGAIGASRAAVDAGYISNDHQVGQTGKVVAPQLYIAVGISGAIQHLAGMKESKIIIAINKDPDAPIFQVADYGMVGDLFEIVPQLTEALSNSEYSECGKL